jgi:tetratricopeptide (TPR) repeat protein
MDKKERDSIMIYNSAVSDYKNKNYKDASDKFKQVLKLNPKDAQAKIALASSYNNYGVELYKAGKVKEALSFFKNALKIEPTNKTYQDNLNIVLQRIKELEFANLALQAYNLFQKKKYELSLKKLLKANQIQPANIEIKKAISTCYNALGIKEYNNGRFAKALKYFELAKENYPQNIGYEHNIKILQNLLNSKTIS